jgi:ketosteroid isomerase-like protein
MRLRRSLNVVFVLGAVVLLVRVARAQIPADKAIDAFNQKEADACRTMDHAATTALWAEDGVDLIQGLQPMVGKSAISHWLDSLTPQLKGAKMEYCTIDWRGIKVEGDFAYEWGITRQKINFPPPQKAVESEGKMLLILKRQPNSAWQIELESWNSLPMRQR